MDVEYRGKYFIVTKSTDYKIGEGYINGFSVLFNHILGIRSAFRKTLKGAIRYGLNKTKNIRDLNNFKFE